MASEGRSALTILSGLAIMVCALLLDTWRAGAFQLRWALLASAVLVTIGVVDLVVAAMRASAAAGRRVSPEVLTSGALMAVILVALVGFGVLERQGLSPNLGQFLRIREHQPFGPAQFSRASDGAIHMAMKHGSGVAVERTMYPLDVTPNANELVAAQRLVESTRQAASQFADFERARTEQGFSIAAAELEGDDTPTLEHLVNPQNMMDDKLLDPNFPESLVFQFTPSGEKRLVAIMYMTRPGQNGPQVGGPLTRWHWHPTAPACMDEFGILRQRKVNDACPPGLSSGPTSEMLHVWLLDHPFGVFAHLMGPPGQMVPGEPMRHDGHH